jgi:hypothetical protein
VKLARRRTDQLAMSRLPRASYALIVSLLPAAAVVIGAVVLGQLLSVAELVAVGLVIAGVAVHHDAGYPGASCYCATGSGSDACAGSGGG